MDTKKAQKLLDALAEAKKALKDSPEYTAFKNAQKAFKEAQTAYHASAPYTSAKKIKDELKKMGGVRRITEYLKLSQGSTRMQELEAEIEAAGE